MNKMEKKMKKNNYKLIGIVALVAVVGLGAGIYYYATKSETNVASANPAQEQGQPARSAELKGFVKSIEGNEIIIINELSDTPELTDAEKAAKKAERSKLSIEERQALKAEESAVLKKEDVVITIPVGVSIKKTTGDATGNLADGSLMEIKEGSYISIWVDKYETTEQVVEFVKIRGSI